MTWVQQQFNEIVNGKIVIIYYNSDKNTFFIFTLKWLPIRMTKGVLCHSPQCHLMSSSCVFATIIFCKLPPLSFSCPSYSASAAFTSQKPTLLFGQLRQPPFQLEMSQLPPCLLHLSTEEKLILCQLKTLPITKQYHGTSLAFDSSLHNAKEKGGDAPVRDAAAWRRQRSCAGQRHCHVQHNQGHHHLQLCPLLWCSLTSQHSHQQWCFSKSAQPPLN